jgi:hypothetical protein
MLWFLVVLIALIGVVVLYNYETFDNDTMIIVQGGGQSHYPTFDFNKYMDAMMMRMHPPPDTVYLQEPDGGSVPMHTLGQGSLYAPGMDMDHSMEHFQRYT